MKEKVSLFLQRACFRCSSPTHTHSYTHTYIHTHIHTHSYTNSAACSSFLVNRPVSYMRRPLRMYRQSAAYPADTRLAPSERQRRAVSVPQSLKSAMSEERRRGGGIALRDKQRPSEVPLFKMALQDA